jgi:hypothetical protein
MKLLIEEESRRLRTSTGEPLSGDNAQIVGYLLVAYEPARTATVDVVVTSPGLAGRYISFRVSLLWAQDDWQAVAPPSGDWGTVATELGAPPGGLVDYREMT